jgi:hypothetical protein
MFQRTVVAIDVGIKNMAVCVVRFPAGADAEEAPPNTLEWAKAHLKNAEVVLWEVGALLTGARPCFADEIDAVVVWALARTQFFENATCVVIEQQMAPKMRCLSAALFASLRAVAPLARFVFQRSTFKLLWADLALCVPGASIDTYCERKWAAEGAVRFLLDLPAVVRGSRTRTQAQPDADVFLSSKKKDDLADALLHVLAHENRRDVKRRPAKRALQPETL